MWQIFTLIGAIFLSVVRAEDVIVNTATGQVQGIKENGVAKFLGIPFAAPPVGNLRWKSPQPAAAWHDVKLATSFGPACPQLSSDLVTLSFPDQSEDCLTLNVWTPANFTLQSNYSVMVWIHGGGYYSDDSSTPAYDGQSLSGNNSVVLVSMNYRLGVLGFLALNELAQENGGTTGNYGFADMQLALTWVQKNIIQFGGNPNNVLLFGESAGGNAVLTHLASPLSKGLFHAALSESGFYRGVYTLVDAVNQGAFIVNATGCTGNADVVGCLRNASVDKLLNTANGCLFLPVIDGYQLKGFPDDLIGTDDFNNVPLQIGANHDEGSLTIYSFFGPNVTEAQYDADVAILSVLMQVPPTSIPKLLKLYPTSNYASPYWALSAMFGDWNLKCSSRRFLRLLSQAYPTQSYYLYEFAYPPDNNGYYNISGDLGSYHGAEISFVYHSNTTFTSENLPLGIAVQSYWAQFAKTHNPTYAGAVKWPAYTKTGDENIFLNVTIRVDVGMNSIDQCAFFDSYPDYIPAPSCTL